MNKEQYIQALEKNLKSLPKEERDEAMAFYEEYLSDLAERNSEKLDTLDDPNNVAAQIKAEVALKSTTEKDIKKKKGISTAWTVLLAIFALPIGLPIAIAVAVIALSLIIVAIALVFSLFAVTLSVGVAGIAALISGVAVIPSNIGISIFYIGCGLFALGLSYLLGVEFYKLSKQIFIWIARLINKMRVKIQKKDNNSDMSDSYPGKPEIDDYQNKDVSANTDMSESYPGKPEIGDYKNKDVSENKDIKDVSENKDIKDANANTNENKDIIENNNENEVGGVK